MCRPEDFIVTEWTPQQVASHDIWVAQQAASKSIYQIGRDAIFALAREDPEYANAYNYHAPYVGFGLLLRDGLITRAEHDLARKQAGDYAWHYCGD